MRPSTSIASFPPSPRLGLRRWQRLVALLVAGWACTAHADVTKEYQVKAAFLYNFTKFIEWPGTRLAREDAPIVIGVLGHNPFGDELQKVVQDRKVNGHAIEIVHLLATPDTRPLQVVFVPAGEEKRFEREIAALHQAGVLTVGESDRFGGIITFTTVDDKVRFEINTPLAERAGLKISAQLQKLASPRRKT